MYKKGNEEKRKRERLEQRNGTKVTEAIKRKKETKRQQKKKGDAALRMKSDGSFRPAGGHWSSEIL